MTESRREEVMERAEAHWPDPRFPPLGGRNALEVDRARLSAAHCDEEADPSVAKTPKRIAECARRRGIEPLRVIDRDDQWRRFREGAEHRSDGRPQHRSRQRLHGRLGPHERGIDGPALRRWEVFDVLYWNGLEQIAKRRQRQRGLSDRGLGSKDHATVGLSTICDLRPDGRLANPGVPL
jgi:hypothetical protein